MTTGAWTPQAFWYNFYARVQALGHGLYFAGLEIFAVTSSRWPAYKAWGKQQNVSLWNRNNQYSHTATLILKAGLHKKPYLHQKETWMQIKVAHGQQAQRLKDTLCFSLSNTTPASQPASLTPLCSDHLTREVRLWAHFLDFQRGAKDWAGECTALTINLQSLHAP